MPDAVLPFGLKLDSEESLRTEHFIGVHEAGRMESDAERLVLNGHAVARFAVTAGEREQKVRKLVFVHADLAWPVVVDHREQRSPDHLRPLHLAVPLTWIEFFDHGVLNNFNIARS